MPDARGDAWPVQLDDDGCVRFVARRVDGVDPAAPPRGGCSAGCWPPGMRPDLADRRRHQLRDARTRPAAARLRRRPAPRRDRRPPGACGGEARPPSTTCRAALDPDDLLITDHSGPIGLAGVMGGASTEIPADATDPIDVLIEAAHFDPGVDRARRPPAQAAQRGVPPLRAHGRSAAAAGRRRAGRRSCWSSTAAAPSPPAAPTRARRRRATAVPMPLELPDRVAGRGLPAGATVRRLTQVGCTVELATGDDGRGEVLATPPSWRPDLAQPADLVEEVLRLEGYDAIPSVLPPAPAGRGLTAASCAAARCPGRWPTHGFVEVLPFPFVDPAVWDAFGLAADDVRRHTVPVLNPLDAERAELATTLLPGPAGHPGAQPGARRRRSRAVHGRAGRAAARTSPSRCRTRRSTGARPTPSSPRSRPRCRPSRCTSGWCWPATGTPAAGGARRPAGWADAVQAGVLVGQAAGVELRVTAAELAPWHPGRCAALRVGDWIVGHAGELHPKVVEALGLPPRTCAMELDLDALAADDARPAPQVSPYPPISVDVALVVPARCRRRSWPTRCWTGAGSCWRTCACSTSTPASRSGRATGRWPSRCASGPRTGR